jgi:hypothetical protein
MSITVTILGAGTQVHCRRAETGPSIIFKQMKRATVKVTRGTQGTVAPENTAPELRADFTAEAVVEAVGAVKAVTARG